MAVLLRFPIQETRPRSSNFRQSSASLASIPLSLIFLCRFTSCYDQDSTQDEIYHNDVEPLIDVVYSGVVRFLKSFRSFFPLTAPVDRHYFCLWSHFIGKDPHDAGHQDGTRSYPQGGQGTRNGTDENLVPSESYRLGAIREEAGASVSNQSVGLLHGDIQG